MSGPLWVIGAGPGLGLAIARRFGREGYPVALISRNAARHDGYLAALRAEGIDGFAYAADVRDPDQLRAAVTAVEAKLGPPAVAYYGPGAADPAARPNPILQTGSAEVTAVIGSFVAPAIDFTQLVLPGFLARGEGTLLYATGLGAVVALPPLGALAVAAAALRTYSLTLGAGLAGTGVHAAALVLGGLIVGSDIHTHAVARTGPEQAPQLPTLDPEMLAEGAWTLTTDRTTEAVFSAL